ncbi:MAG: hypothetical protein ACRECX_07535 [Methyloceanibacter sp.]|uniref:hypothetical protein n=1 Tax=Methyloceanibacter sp. TaxID=1965321 RepID=UPI003D6CBC3B
MQRAAERAAPDLAFQGPIRPTSLTSAQVKQVQSSVAKSLKDPASAKFGDSYKAGIGPDRETLVCGFVNGKRFVGMFAKPQRGATEFLPIRVATTEEEQGAVRDYCRANGIYVPQ